MVKPKKLGTGRDNKRYLGCVICRKVNSRNEHKFGVRALEFIHACELQEEFSSFCSEGFKLRKDKKLMGYIG